MQWIDIVAAVVARRHSGMDVTTACVDSLIFLAPAHLGDTILLKGRISYVGNTSMEVNVKTYVEELCGRRSLVNNAHMLMVAVDKSGHPQKVPPLIIKTGAERAEWQAAQTRRELRDKQRI